MQYILFPIVSTNQDHSRPNLAQTDSTIPFRRSSSSSSSSQSHVVAVPSSVVALDWPAMPGIVHHHGHRNDGKIDPPPSPRVSLSMQFRWRRFWIPGRDPRPEKVQSKRNKIAKNSGSCCCCCCSTGAPQLLISPTRASAQKRLPPRL